MSLETHILSRPVFAWSIGWPEIVLVLLLVLLLFGGRKLPELARSMARGLRIFKDEMKGIKKDLDETTEEPTDKPDGSESSQAQQDSRSEENPSDEQHNQD